MPIWETTPVCTAWGSDDGAYGRGGGRVHGGRSISLAEGMFYVDHTNRNGDHWSNHYAIEYWIKFR